MSVEDALAAVPGPSNTSLHIRQEHDKPIDDDGYSYVYKRDHNNGDM